MILSHVVSDSILCATAVLSLLWYRRHLSGELRFYLSITVALIGVTAFLGALRFMGFAAFAEPTDTAARLGETVGITAFALGFWSAIVVPVPQRIATSLLVAASLVFVGVLVFGMNALSLPVQGAGILTLVFLAITRREQHPEASKWLGVGLLAFVVGAVAYPALANIVDTPVLRSLDIYHYCVVAAILAISRSAATLSRDQLPKPTRIANA
jgi:hypothetical protein